MTTQTSRPVEFTHSAYDGGPIHGVLRTNDLRRRLNPFVTWSTSMSAPMTNGDSIGIPTAELPP